MSTVLFNSVKIFYKPTDKASLKDIFIENGKLTNPDARDWYLKTLVEPYRKAHLPMYTSVPLLIDHDEKEHKFTLACATALFPEVDDVSYFRDLRENIFNEICCNIMNYFLDYVGGNEELTDIIEDMEIDIHTRQISFADFTHYIVDIYPPRYISKLFIKHFKLNPSAMIEKSIQWHYAEDSIKEYENLNFNPLTYPNLCNELLKIEQPLEDYVHPYRNYIIMSDIATSLASIIIKQMALSDRLRSVVSMRLDPATSDYLQAILDNHVLDGMDGQSVIISINNFADDTARIHFSRTLKSIMRLYPKVLFLLIVPEISATSQMKTFVSHITHDMKNLYKIHPGLNYGVDAAKEIMIKHITDRYGKLNYKDRKAVESSIDKYFKDTNNDEYYLDDILSGASLIIEDYHNKQKNPDFCILKSPKDSKIVESKSSPVTNRKQTMHDLVGLTSVKELSHKIIVHYSLMNTYREKGIQLENMSRHMIFTGNPGTAKTTVARLLFEELKKREVVEDVFVEVGRADLVAEYVGQTAVKVKKAFAKATGGILFIDEAYSLAQDTSKGFGSEAIATIVQEMENHRDDTIVIFAGYKKEMDDFVKSNPGLKSRIAFHLDFPDYSKDELMEILKLMVKRNTLTMTPSAVKYVRDNLDKISITPERGNGRLMRNILEAAIMNHSLRISEIKDYENVSKKVLSTLTVDDFKDTIKQDSSSDKKRIGFGV